MEIDFWNKLNIFIIGKFEPNIRSEKFLNLTMFFTGFAKT